MATYNRTILNYLLRRPKFSSYNRVEISQSAIRSNLELFHRLTNLLIAPVLKGNAYGHGISEVCRALSMNTPNWVPYIAVDSYTEALTARKYTRLPILIMGKILPENFEHLKYKDFAFVVSDMDSIKALGHTGRKVNLHLELNTGMNRYGIRSTEVKKILEGIKQCPNLRVVGIMSHLADSDGTKNETVEAAVNIFDTLTEQIESILGPVKYKHIAQTAGSIRATSRCANMIRLGIGLYGINPFDLSHPSYDTLSELKPAMKIISTIASVQEVEVGEGVGYNYTFVARRMSRVAILPLGYYEGIPRELSDLGHVTSENGLVLPIIGRVCMNHIMIDITDTKLEVGDEICVISSDSSAINSIESIAAQFGLFKYSLLTNISNSNRRSLIS